MPIAGLIDKSDNFELVRLKIAALLVAESASQQALATAALEDPDLWKLRVFEERANPWNEWLECTDDTLDVSPIVNVALDGTTVDLAGSDVVERQKYTANYHVDCFGVGVAQAGGGGGHTPADLASVNRAHRAVRLVRNILMAGTYARLELPKVVGRRMVTGVQFYEVRVDERAAFKVCAARITFRVDLIELSPQVEAAHDTIDTIGVTVRRMHNGEVVSPEQTFDIEFDHS